MTALYTKMIYERGQTVNRAGGARFYPYGDEITGTANDHEKFGTYQRDAFSGLDYADQRYYASSYGRFNTADPYMAAANGANDPSTPGSWNKYAYVLGDPVNQTDRHGLYLDASNDWDDCVEDDVCVDGPDQGGSGDGYTAPPPSCDITVAFSGTPAYKQNLNQGNHPNPTNQLGAYSISQGGVIGGYFGVQIQGALYGDTNTTDWYDSQIVAASGTVWNGSTSTPFTFGWKTDPLGQSPTVSGTDEFGTTYFDWLDEPGYTQLFVPGLVGLNVTDYFTSTLTNRPTGQSCSVDWSVTLNSNATWSHRITAPTRHPVKHGPVPHKYLPEAGS